MLLCLIDRQPGRWDSEFDWVKSRSKGASFVSIPIELTWDGFFIRLWRPNVHSQTLPSRDQVFHCVRFAVKCFNEKKASLRKNCQCFSVPDLLESEYML